MAAPCTGVILAGGLNTRFDGQNKAFIKIGGKRILDRLLDVYTRLFEQVGLVTNDPAACKRPDHWSPEPPVRTDGCRHPAGDPRYACPRF